MCSSFSNGFDPQNCLVIQGGAKGVMVGVAAQRRQCAVGKEDKDRACSEGDKPSSLKA